MKLTILRGISGCGKSTEAAILAAQGAKVVSRDAIRIGLFDFEFDPTREDEVTLIEHAMLEAYLKAGYDVVSDNTNIENKFMKNIAKIGYKYGAEVEVKVFDISLDEAKKRNDKRAALGGRFVPHDVIERQHDRLKKTRGYQLPVAPPVRSYEGTPGKPKAFMYDLDGTVYHMNGKRGPYDHNVDIDDPDLTVMQVVNSIAQTTGWMAIAMSGRKSATRERTIDSLNRDNCYFDLLYMRADGDDRADNIIKAELFDSYIRDHFDVQMVIDDRLQVVKMWQRMGLKVLNVAGIDGGDF